MFFYWWRVERLPTRRFHQSNSLANIVRRQFLKATRRSLVVVFWSWNAEHARSNEIELTTALVTHARPPAVRPTWIQICHRTDQSVPVVTEIWNFRYIEVHKNALFCFLARLLEMKFKRKFQPIQPRKCCRFRKKLSTRCTLDVGKMWSQRWELSLMINVSLNGCEWNYGAKHFSETFPGSGWSLIDNIHFE